MTRFIFHVLFLAFIGGMCIVPNIEMALRVMAIIFGYFGHQRVLNSLNHQIEMTALGVSYQKYLSDATYHNRMNALDQESKALDRELKKIGT